MKRKNKIISVLISLIISFGLWLYVVSFVSIEHTDTIYDIRVAFAGETVLAERNLMIVSGTDPRVNLTLTGSRSDLTKVNKDNITLKVDLTKVYDEGVHQLDYDITFPGDVPTNAFVVETKYPNTIAIHVEKIGRSEVPVQVVYSGSAAENFLTDTENATLDYSTISVTGPNSVVEQIDHARIDVDLTGRNESVSESYRYTLCDAEGNPVDVSMVTTNVAEVRLEVKIQRYEEIPLRLTAAYGGGATEATTRIDIQPATIRVSGSDALLEEVTEIHLGTVDLATITENTNMTFPINLPEGVTNLSGITDAAVDISFEGLSIKEFTITQINAVNVPEGLEYELINEVLKVTLRGPTKLINSITPEDIVATVDFSGKEIGTMTIKATISLADEAYAEVGAVGSHSVSATLRVKTDEQES